MNARLATYIKPSVLDLDFETDVSVSMAQNCKTTGSSILLP